MKYKDGKDAQLFDYVEGKSIVGMVIGIDVPGLSVTVAFLSLNTVTTPAGVVKFVSIANKVVKAADLILDRRY